MASPKSLGWRNGATLVPSSESKVKFPTAPGLNYGWPGMDSTPNLRCAFPKPCFILEEANWWISGGLIDEPNSRYFYKNTTNLYSSGSWHGSFGRRDESKEAIFTPGGQHFFLHCMVQINPHEVALIGGSTEFNDLSPNGYTSTNTNVSQIFQCIPWHE